MTSERTSKEFKNLASFSKDILVICPNCGNQASVLTKIGQHTVPHTFGTTSVFRCINCHQRINEKQWYGPINLIVSRRCGQCGSPIEKRIEKTTNYKAKLKVKCENCGTEKLYDTNFELTFSNSKQATDPYFGLDLWLQTQVGENVFWAYNHDHLEYLKAYVSAKLREAASGGKYSLAWKLPNFIKHAKNRDRILKAINRLERK